MSEIINVITAKPEWQTKINDETIVAKWKEELEAQGIPENVLDKAIELLKKSSGTPKTREFDDEAEYPWHIQVGAGPEIWSGCRECGCMICSEDEHLAQQLEDYEEDDEDYRDIQKKLKKYAKMKCKCQNHWVDDNLNFLRENIYHKVNLVKADLKQRFLTHVKDFEARKTEKDYHPGSNDQMLDIIHPALYCYVKGVTRVVGEGEALVDKSSLFQWIPSDFSVIRDPTTKEPIRTEIRSYINNLDRADPRNGDLYEDISEIFTTMVPGFEKVLNKMKADNRINAIKTPFNKQPRHPQDIQLNDCQVIVKIASAEVNSDKPEFSEGSWHLEGVDSEKIIATGIYYYDMKGTDKSYLRFRTTLTGDIFRRSSSGDTYSRIDYPTNCAQYVRVHCGLKLENRNNMDIDTIVKLGRIPTKENLSLFFPNFLQHRVSSLHLKEGATEGHRSILVFFLINPFEKVISTSHIPTPQQETVSLGDAKLYRELLMFERKYEYTDQQSYHQRGVTLCEH